MDCSILYDTDGIPYKKKVPVGRLDYKVDLAPLTNGRVGAESDWLESGEAVTAHSVSADAGITVDSSSVTDSGTSITVWLDGGTYTAGVDTEYDVTVYFETSGAREDERTFRIKMVEKR